jgi:hypothetical protein
MSDGRPPAGEPQNSAPDYTRDGSVYDSSPAPDSKLGILRFMPATIHSGFDGRRTFKAPIAVYDADDDLEVVADDPAAVTIARTRLTNSAGDTGEYFMITTRTAKTVKLTATSGGRTATATILISEYDATRWGVGEIRYENGGPAGNPPCTRCHVDGRAIDHSPASLASATDSQVGVIVTSGVRPGPAPITTVSCDDCSDRGKQHRWSVTNEEKAGLITYLRALEPRGFE